MVRKYKKDCCPWTCRWKEFLTTQAMEMATADVVHIKNKDTEDLHKMCTAKQSSTEIQKGKRLCFGCFGKGHDRRIECPALGKICFKCQKKNLFSRQWQNEQRESLSHYMQEQDTYVIPLYMTSSSKLKQYVCKLELNGISCETEIDTGCSSSLIR